MSGAAGHLMHLHENRELTLGDIKEALRQATAGTLQRVTEKFDGINIVFTWDNGIKVARNTSDFAQGGMNEAQLQARFTGRGSIKDAFVQAFQVLNQATSVLSSQELHAVFDAGRGDNRWYSAEVIYPSGANTINYDSNCIVFHGYPVFDHSPDTGTRQVTDAAGVDILATSIERMQTAIKLRGWRVMGPAMVQLHDIDDGYVLRNAFHLIDDAATTCGADDRDTLATYLELMAVVRAEAAGLSERVAAQVAKRITNQRGALNLPALVKMDVRKADVINRLVKDDKKLVASFIQPIELAISNVAKEVLKGMRSILIADGHQEVKRLKDQVSTAIDWLMTTGADDDVQAMQNHMTKLRHVDDIAAAMEGIVFVFKGEAYKMTGAWAPAHQILSLYQRRQ